MRWRSRWLPVELAALLEQAGEVGLARDDLARLHEADPVVVLNLQTSQVVEAAKLGGSLLLLLRLWDPACIHVPWRR